MATIHAELLIDVAPADAWQAIRDVGAVYTRLVPGILTDAMFDGDTRVVTFANGMVLTERIVTRDDSARRLVFSATGGRTTHHNASLQAFATDNGRTRLVWITDLLPDDAPRVRLRSVAVASEPVDVSGNPQHCGIGDSLGHLPECPILPPIQFRPVAIASPVA